MRPLKVLHFGELQSLTFGKEITKIPDLCYYNDLALTEVVIPEGVTSIGKWAFDSCTSLKSLTIPSTVSEVEDSFYEETQLIFKNASFQQRENGTYVNGISVNVTAKERYDYAFQVLELVNAERAKLRKTRPITVSYTHLTLPTTSRV